MKAVFPCSYYLPETAASLYLTDNIIHACAEQDLEVDLYTPTPTRAVPEGAKWKRNRCGWQVAHPPLPFVWRG